MRRSRPYHLPFFQLKKTNGEIEELTLGPSVGSVLKCLICGKALRGDFMLAGQSNHDPSRRSPQPLIAGL